MHIMQILCKTARKCNTLQKYKYSTFARKNISRATALWK
jgi:hypothetical protein